MRDFLTSLLAYRTLLVELTKRDLTAAYSGSVAGNVWVVVNPLVYVALTLLFFQFAIKGVDTGGVPYVAWVLPVIVFWTYINTVLSASVGAVQEYSYLLRHRSFDMRLVIVIKILSASVVLTMLMFVLLLVLALFMDVRLGLRTLGVLYYYFAMTCLLLPMGWLLAALGTFWKDIRNLVSIFLQVGFWISPIFWEPDHFPKPLAMVMYLNPLYYPMHGYRQSVLSGDFGSHFWLATIYFWLVVALLLFFGSRVFARLSRDFGDVL